MEVVVALTVMLVAHLHYQEEQLFFFQVAAAEQDENVLRQQ
jgi:hypothetical protein